MGSQDPASDWDLAAEEELQAIEAAYTSKSKQTRFHLDNPDDSLAASCHRSPRRRRLPDWENGARIRPSNHGDHHQARAPRRPTAEGPSPSCPANDTWSLAPHPRPVNFKMRHPAMTFGGRIVYCRTTREVERATSDLLDKIRDLKQNADKISLGFDIEWKPVFRRGEAPSKAAVMQICVDSSHCYVMHIIHSGIPSILKSLLEDYSSVKVGIAIAGDATKILKDYNVCVEPLEDLSVIANLKLGGTYKSWGLASLTETLTCKELAKPKKIRMGNWEVRTLSREQLQYAATDAFVSWYLYEILKSFPDWKPDSEIAEKANEKNVEESGAEVLP